MPVECHLSYQSHHIGLHAPYAAQMDVGNVGHAETEIDGRLRRPASAHRGHLGANGGLLNCRVRPRRLADGVVDEVVEKWPMQQHARVLQACRQHSLVSSAMSGVHAPWVCICNHGHRPV